MLKPKHPRRQPQPWLQTWTSGETCKTIAVDTTKLGLKKLLLIFLTALFATNASHAQHHITKLWDKQFGGNLNDYPLGITESTNKSFVMAGTSNSDSSYDKSQQPWPGAMGYDYWVIKIDSNLNKQWDKRYGGAGMDDLESFRKTNDGGFILAGISNSSATGDHTQANCYGDDYWIIKIDSDGNKEWNKGYGGNGYDYLYGIEQTAKGGYIMVGLSNSGIKCDKTEDDWDPTHFYDDGWVVCVDDTGKVLWNHSLGGINQEDLVTILLTSDGGYLLGGSSSSDSSGNKMQNSKGGFDFWIIQLNSDGVKQWDKTYGGDGDDFLSQIFKTNDGGYILGGYSTSKKSGDKGQNSFGQEDYWILKVDSAWVKQWDKTFGASEKDQFDGIIQTLDNGFLIYGISWSGIAGGTKTENNLGFFQEWVIKTDSSFKIQWDKTIITPGINSGKVIQTEDGCYVMGAQATGVAGGYKSQSNYDPTNETTDFWIVKFCDTVLAVDINDITPGGATVTISPNPFTTDIAIAVQKENLQQATFTIANLLGQQVYTKQENNLSASYTKMLDLSYLPNGIYFVQVEVDGERVVREMVKVNGQ